MSEFRIRHFHQKGSGRLVATIATRTNADGSIMMAVARCNPADVPLKEAGRKLAIARLQRFFLFKNKMLSGDELSVAREEIRRKLVVDISHMDFIQKVIQSNPFVRGNCQFGVKT
jgi:hypothetical protein